MKDQRQLSRRRNHAAPGRPAPCPASLPKLWAALAFICLFSGADLSGQLIVERNPDYPRNKYDPLIVKTVFPNAHDQCTGLYEERLTRYAVDKLKLTQMFKPIQVNVTDVPIVVVSSNRSSWIEDQMATRPESRPWYVRLERPVYFVVPQVEAESYKRRLGTIHQQSGLVVVGCNSEQGLAGFGFTRFCAIRLLKKLGYDKGWLVDDNVMQVRRSNRDVDSQTLTTIEKVMADDPSIWGIGFGHRTGQVIHRDGVDLRVLQPQAFLQQVVLWNVGKLRDRGLNFSRLFVASKEDVSFSKMLLRTENGTNIAGENLQLLSVESSTIEKNHDTIKDKEEDGSRQLAMVQALYPNQRMGRLGNNVRIVALRINYPDMGQSVHEESFLHVLVNEIHDDYALQERPLMTFGKAAEQIMNACIGTVGANIVQFFRDEVEVEVSGFGGGAGPD